MKKIARSFIKYIDIRATPNKVFNFIANPMNWPQYAIVNLLSVQEGSEGWFKANTKFGEGNIKMYSIREYGVLDHIWKDPNASWTVYARVVPNDEGSTFMMTFFQPSTLSDHQFDSAMIEMDIEMEKLKDILEK